jgi:hypothetical protein
VELITAVAKLVRDQGLDVGVPVKLRSTNNVVTWMRPSPVVAKMARDVDASAQELQVATSLAALGAPVVPPIEIGIAQPVNLEGHWVTFWQYIADERTATASRVAASLHALHAGLAKVPGRSTFRPCQGRLEAAVDLLGDPELAAGLSRDDCALLRRALLDGIDALNALTGPLHVLHGSPHRLNILVTGGKVVFIDFETVELGPVEWDLAHLEEEVGVCYPADLDQDLLRTCRIAISAATSTWCWEGITRGVDMLSHAEHHLETVRRLMT